MVSHTYLNTADQFLNRVKLEGLDSTTTRVKRNEK